MKNYILTILGVGLFASGLYFIKTIEDSHAFPFIFVGLGCVIFGHGMGEILLQRAMKGDTAAAKQLEIDMKDERNLAIANQAKAKAYDMMVFVFGALLFSVALMGIDLQVLLLFVFTYMLIIGYSTYYRFKFNKEM
jgi:hypothetical protein